MRVRCVLVASIAIVLVSVGSNVSAAPQTCIAILQPSVHGVEGSATDVGNGLRDLFASFLNGPSVRTIALDARLLSQAIEEAREKQCPNILVTTLTRKTVGHGVLKHALGTAAGTAAWQVPGVGVGSAVARGAAVGGAQAVSVMAASTRAKDELTLDYKFATLDDVTQASAVTSKAKAKIDREDLLTPMVEHATEAIVSGIAKK